MRTRTLLGTAIGLGILLCAYFYFVPNPWLARLFPSLYEQPAFGVSMVTEPAAAAPLMPVTLMDAKAATVTCSQCKGSGRILCPAPDCKDGKIDCPGNCLKLSVGHWEHLDVPGHSSTELWQKFYFPGGWAALSQAHCGHLYEIRDRQAIDLGPCPTCEGASKVACPVCNGEGSLICPTCGGRGQLAAEAPQQASN